MTIIEHRAFQAVSELPGAIAGLKTPDLVLLAGMAMQSILAKVESPIDVPHSLSGKVAEASLVYAKAVLDLCNEVKNK